MEDDDFDEEEEEDCEEGEEVLWEFSLIKFVKTCVFNQFLYAVNVGRRRGRSGPGLQTEEDSRAWSKGSS